MKVTKFAYDKNEGWSLDLPQDKDSSQTLILVFGASSYLDNYKSLAELNGKFPNSKVIGCSTAGEIFDSSINDESLSGVIVKFENTEIKTAFAPVSQANESFSAGAKIAQMLNEPSLSGILVLSDGLNVNGSELVRGINSIVSDKVKVTGGLAGDGPNFQKTWVLKDGVPKSNFVSAVGFYGENIQIGHGSRGGWDIFGPERKITKSIGNQLFELDGKPALDLYKNYLGELADELPASALSFPLALRSDYFDKKRIVRTVLNIDEKNSSMIFAGDIPEGAFAQLMRTNRDHLIDGACDAAVMANRESHISEDLLCIAISCVGRRLVLGERAEEELEAVLDEMQENTTQIGFYSYGEISPFETGYCDLHNQTMTLTTISER